MTRMFVAAWPTEAVRRRLAGLARPTEPGVRWVPRQNWHVTLRFIGDADPDEVADRLAAASLPGVTATLGPTVVTLGRRQLVVPVEGVDPLAAAVRSATAGIGTEDRFGFRGHLTIARLKQGARSSLTGHRVDDEFEITDIALVASELRAEGAVYVTLDRFATM